VEDQREPRRLRGVLERAVAAVPVEDVAAPRRRDVEVLVAVSVRVAERRRHRDAVLEADARRLRRLDEPPAPLVAVQRVRPQLVAEVEVVVAVPVDVRDGDARAVVVEVDLELLALFAG
jgi:hypothetical protein